MFCFFFVFVFIEVLANHSEAMFHLTRVTEEKKSLQRSLNEYINNHCNCDKVIKFTLLNKVVST